MKKYQVGLLVLLLMGAFALRLIGLASNPPGLFRDEADKGYTTYCLLQTGQDQAGHPWPLFVKAMNVTTSALYQYVDMPFVAALGLTETAVRLPACLAGTLSVVVTFLLVRSLWGFNAGLWAGFFVCLCPWSLLLSRWANQSILLTVSVPLGIFFLVRQRDTVFPSVGHAILSAMFFLVAIYTYAPARMVIPILVVLLWAVSMSAESLGKEHRPSFFRSAAVFFLIFTIGCLPLAYHVLYQSPDSGARLSRITINDGQPIFSLMGEFIGNYLLHFSPRFLFFRGDENFRHSTSMLGQLHLYLLPLVVMGVMKAFKRRSRIDRILLVWFFCFPLAAAFTRERIPHALRSVFAVPVFQVLAVYGIVAWREWKNWVESHLSGEALKLLVKLWIASLVLCPTIYLYDLFFHYPRYASVDWEYGYREAIDWWMAHRQDADKTVVSGLAEYPYVFFLFYDRYSPQKWISEQRIDGVEFVPTGQATQSVAPPEEGRILYLLRPNEIPMALSETVVYLPSGEPIWKWIAWGKKL